MTRVLVRIAAAIMASAVGLTGTAVSAQQAFPTRPIHVLLGFPPGGGADILTRHFVARLQTVSGNTFVLENKPGASGNLAVTLAANAKPDGYTILVGPSSSMVGARFFFKDVAWDALKSFVPLGSLIEGAFVLVVGPNAQAKSLAELTAYLKSRPNNRFAYSNQVGLLAAHYYKAKGGFPAEAVSYKSAPEAFPDLQTGLIEFMVSDGTSSVQPIKDGRIKALAVTTAHRHPAIADVPTMREQGLSDADFSTWWAMFAPAGTEASIAATLSKWVSEAASDEGTAQFLLKSGNAPLNLDPPAITARLKSEAERWAPLVKAAGIEPQ
jgi:tripartite-type tricarboxylate transporter receptor subunit TctC